MDVPLDADRFERGVRAALAEARARIDRFRTQQGGAPAEVLRAFDRLLQPLNGVEGRVGLYVGVHPDPALRVRCEALEREIAELRTALSLDRAVFDRLAAIDPAALEDEAARRLLSHARRDFARSGVDRAPETRAK